MQCAVVTWVGAHSTAPAPRRCRRGAGACSRPAPAGLCHHARPAHLALPAPSQRQALPRLPLPVGPLAVQRPGVARRRQAGAALLLAQRGAAPRGVCAHQLQQGLVCQRAVHVPPVSGSAPAACAACACVQPQVNVDQGPSPPLPACLPAGSERCRKTAAPAARALCCKCPSLPTHPGGLWFSRPTLRTPLSTCG